MNKRSVSLGKFRALQRASTPDGLFTVLAIDHQDALRRALNPHDPLAISPADLTDFKLDVVGAIAPHASAVLLDPVYGAAQAVVSGRLPHGLLIEMEKADYNMAALPLDVQIRPEWSVSKIKRMGADGVKLFFYYHPDAVEHAAAQDAVVRKLVAECARYDLPLYAEPILYPLNDQPVSSAKTTEVVVESARRMAELGADILKLEFPCAVEDEANWAAACRAVTEAVDAPWVLLSAGVAFDTFVRQVEAACANGASGFIAGRALWGDACRSSGRQERAAWLQTVGIERLRVLHSAAQCHARPWYECIGSEPISESWYQTYASLEE